MIQYPRQPLARVLKRIQDTVELDPEKIYKQVTVRLFHKGVVLRGTQEGAMIRTSRQWRIQTGQILLSRIDARNGAVGLVPFELDGAVVTNDFWAFEVNAELAYPKFLDLYFGTSEFVEACQVASEGTTNRVRLQPARFLQINVPLPPLDEQLRIVARIEELSGKIEEARTLQHQIEADAKRILLGLFQKVIANVDFLPMADVAPVVRRQVEIETEGNYPELGIRSFGKGTFHKPALLGVDVGTKRLYRIKPGDLVFNNVFAWEGAVAVSTPKDAGRFGSHRFITCVPNKEVVTSSFLCFYFLTTEGLEKLGEASPGGAGRNRTLGLEALNKIKVPIPNYEKQLWFDRLQAKVDAVKRLQVETAEELDAFMPSILSRAFYGAL